MKDTQRLFAFTTLSIVLALSGCLGGPEPTDPQDPEIGSNEEALGLRGPYCGCENSDDRDCREVHTNQWACSYGWPCNYVVYKADCSYANQCPATTWNGCPLASQVCRDTGLKCEGHCGNGDPCTIQHDWSPIEPAPAPISEPLE